MYKLTRCKNHAPAKTTPMNAAVSYPTASHDRFGRHRLTISKKIKSIKKNRIAAKKPTTICKAGDSGNAKNGRSGADGATYILVDAVEDAVVMG